MPKDDNEKTTDSETENTGSFSNLDLNKCLCFGIEHQRKHSWVDICMRSLELGWPSINLKDLERSLTRNVNESYFNLATFFLTDLDDDVKYTCLFDNQKCMWNLRIQDSPKAEIDLQQKSDFFKSDMFMKIASRSADLISRASDMYHDVIEQHLRNGELLEVDEIKLSAILHIINQKGTLDNIRNGKWMK